MIHGLLKNIIHGVVDGTHVTLKENIEEREILDGYLLGTTSNRRGYL